ncbi:ankyrin repeat-containing domain protein, partial [Phlyctochytrium arcticum]
TLVHYAAALGRVPLVRALLQAGASPTVTAYGGETPLMRAVYHMACYDSQTFAQLTNLLRDSVYVADLASRTVLHHIAKAAKRRDIWTAAGYYARCVAQVLEEEYSEALDLLPQVVNLRDSQGNTALHYACKYGNRVVTEILLRLGAATDITNNNGETPLD